MDLLKAIPKSVLWLLASHELARSNLLREAASRGIDTDRLIFAGRVTPSEHLARHTVADLFLDTLPYNAHTTASDALWMGLPLLTCVGKTFAGRVAGSLLNALAMPELITYSLQEYEAAALRIAQEPAYFADLRRRLALNLKGSGLFDMAEYTRNIERAFVQMLSTFLSGSFSEKSQDDVTNA
jgi:predicted O-linked N-acetylglucosamine transferase (SPINDLY family)